MMATISIVFILIMGSSVVLYIHKLDKSYEEFSKSTIETTTHIVSQFIFDGMMQNDKEVIQRHLELLGMEPAIKLVRIFKASGEILFSSKVEELNQNINNFSEPEVQQNEMTRFGKIGNYYSHLEPIYIQEKCTKCHIDQMGEVIAFMNVQAGFTESEQIYSSAKYYAIWGAAIVIIILWIFTSILYQSKIGSKLEKLNQGFQKLAESNFDTEVNMTGKHELALMANNFNQTVKKLREARENENLYLQEKFARADRLITLGELATEIAHEVNNPAGIILTRTEWIRDKIAEEKPDHQVLEDLDSIINQIGRISDSTLSILHYAQRFPSKFSTIDLKEVIHESIKLLEPRIKKQETKVLLDFPEQPAIIIGNSIQLKQVFCNIINNSLDVVSEGVGIIQIFIKNKIKNLDNSLYRIQISDNGPGIPDSIHDKIFTPFFTTKKNEKGTGLGLFIAKNIIKNHGGELSIIKPKSHGANFLIDLKKK